MSREVGGKHRAVSARRSQAEYVDPGRSLYWDALATVLLTLGFVALTVIIISIAVTLFNP